MKQRERESMWAIINSVMLCPEAMNGTCHWQSKVVFSLIMNLSKSLKSYLLLRLSAHVVSDWMCDWAWVCVHVFEIVYNSVCVTVFANVSVGVTVCVCTHVCLFSCSGFVLINQLNISNLHWNLLINAKAFNRRHNISQSEQHRTWLVK